MVNIDIKKLKNIQKDLETLDENDVAYIQDEGESKYVIMPINQFDEIDSFRSLLEDNQTNHSNVKIITNAFNELTYDEYEKIRDQLIEVLDKTLKPNPEKYN